jgi:sugar phosphate isomerase/epimerase
MEHNLNRRRFLGAAVGTGAVAAIAPGVALASGPRTGHDQGRGYRGRVSLGDISIQLYTLREIMRDQQQARRTLQALGAIGYRNVELAGRYNWNARQLKRVLDNAGLHAHSSHDNPLGPNFTISPGYRQLVEDMVEIGQEYTGLAYYRSENPDDWKRLAQAMNQAGRITAEHGIQFFYHNHDFEFTIKRPDGRPVYDTLLEETDRNLVKFELDLYWIIVGGANPLAYLSEDPERFPLYHVKDKTWADRPDAPDFEDVGPGSIDFPDIFAAGARRGLRKYYIIEHDEPELSHPDAPDAPLITAQVGFDYLRTVRF